jgi:hypothetical protein
MKTSLPKPIGYQSDDRIRIKLERKYQPLLREEFKLGRLVSYIGNRDIPILRLYRYKEAFSFEFVRYFLREFNLGGKDYLLDPFAGMGTTLFASMLQRIPSIGIDRLPIAAFLAETLPAFLFLKKGTLIETYKELKDNLDKVEPAEVADDVRIMKLAFEHEILVRLRKWKTVIKSLPQPLRNIFLLLFFSILEPASYTSKDGQFLRLKRDKKPQEPDRALWQKVLDAENDLERIRWLFPRWDGARNYFPRVILADTKKLDEVPFERPPTAIITSPPYANRYDYTRSYSLELCFNFVEDFEELKEIRHSILRSHIESRVNQTEVSSHSAVQEVIRALRNKSLNNPKIPDMLNGYFIDMEKAISEWARVLAKKARIALVVDNVRFEGELIPVDLILSEMAEDVGFETRKILITRYKGNSSQQMRKYGRVPVRESVILWEKAWTKRGKRKARRNTKSL